MQPIDLIQVVAVIAAVLVYYGLVVQRVGDYPARVLLRVVMDRFQASKNYSADELDSVIRLSLAGVMQLLFCVVLLIMSDIEPRQLIPSHIDPVLIVYGIVLGVGEAALGSFLGYVGIRTAMQFVPARVPPDVSTWMLMAKGGWIRFYLKTAAVAPLWLALAIGSLYVAFEEIVFRGVLINALLDAGALVALGVSAVLFVAVQAFNMPSWQTAMFPMFGALVMGLVHGSLYLAVPDLVPLMIAHIVAFTVAVI
jgi:membrane protease YdiL (CAAX protease family)